MIVPNLHFQHNGLSSQIDFMVFSSKVCFVIECKNIYGDIEVNESGSFLRSFKVGERMIKEGFYSPFTQNKRHMDLLRSMRKERQSFVMKKISNHAFDISFTPLIVLSNPKTVLNVSKAPKEIKESIIRADQLLNYIEKTISKSSMPKSNIREIIDWAERIISTSQPSLNPKSLINKYSSFIISEAEESKDDDSCFDLKNELINYRLTKSKSEVVKPYYIFNNNELESLLRELPRDTKSLLEIKGFGPYKVEKYGDDIISIINKS